MKEVKAKEHFSDDYIQGLEDAAEQAEQYMNGHLSSVEGIVESVSDLSGGPGGWPDYERALTEIREHWQQAEACKRLAAEIREMKTEWWISAGLYDSDS